MKTILYDENGKAFGELITYETKETDGKVIALVVGHDKDRQGAYGNKGISEWLFNDRFLIELVPMLPEKHTYFIFYRSADIKGYTNKMVDLHSRIDEIGCDISIEFHFNSVADSSVNGNEVLYCSNNGLKLANILDDCFDILPNRGRGVKKVTLLDNGGGFCCNGKSTAIITEPFFGSEQSDYVHNGKYRHLLQEAYVDFFLRI